MSRFQFVADHLHAFEVKWLCAVMEIARSSFYAWLAAADGRAAREAARCDRGAHGHLAKQSGERISAHGIDCSAPAFGFDGTQAEHAAAHHQEE